MSWTRPCHGQEWSHRLLYLTLLLWSRRISGLADFSSKVMMVVMMMMHIENGGGLRSAGS